MSTAIEIPLILGGNGEKNEEIKPGDIVIVYETQENISYIYVEAGKSFDNRFGRFSHDSFIGKHFGDKIFAQTSKRGDSYVYALRPSPELWMKALKHRTQIIYATDACMITAKLELKPGFIVVESGTGSGSLSTCIARAIAPHGRLYTFEFNESRASIAREEFSRNRLSEIITVTHADACQDGFGNLENCVDAVFLDLPSPWLSVPFATKALKIGRMICSFSPCIEQVQRMAQSLKLHGYTDIQTIECLQRPIVFSRQRADKLDLHSLFQESKNEIEDTENSKDNERNDSDAESSTLGDTKQESRKRKYSQDKSRKSKRTKQTDIEVSSNVMTRGQSEIKGHTAYLTFARKVKVISSTVEGFDLIKRE